MIVVVAGAVAAVVGAARGAAGAARRAPGRPGGGASGAPSGRGSGAFAPAAAVRRALSLRTTWIVFRIVLVCTSTVGVAVGRAAAVVTGAGDDGRAIAAAATPPSADSTATAAMTGVRRLMRTPSAPTPQATGSAGKGLAKPNLLTYISNGNTARCTRSMCSATGARRILELLAAGEQTSGAVAAVIQAEFGIPAGGVAAPAGVAGERVRHRAGGGRPPAVRGGLRAAAGGGHVARPFRRFWNQHLDALGTELARAGGTRASQRREQAMMDIANEVERHLPRGRRRRRRRRRRSRS